MLDSLPLLLALVGGLVAFILSWRMTTFPPGPREEPAQPAAVSVSDARVVKNDDHMIEFSVTLKKAHSIEIRLDRTVFVHDIEAPIEIGPVVHRPVAAI